MQMQSLLAKIIGFLVIVITLALAPTIDTANVAISGHANVTQMLGMTVISGFGAPLIIIGLLVAGGLFALSGVRGQLKNASMGDMMSVIGSVIVIIVALTFEAQIMTYNTALMLGKSGFDYTLYSVIPLLVYIGIITSAGWNTARVYRKARGSRSRAARSYGY